MVKPIVVLTRTWTKTVEKVLAQKFDARLNPHDRILSEDEIIDLCQGATVLCPAAVDTINASLISRLPKEIKLIATLSAGTQHIDLSAANNQGIQVSNTPHVVSEDTADLTMGLILAVCRRMVELDTTVRSGKWQGFKVDDPLSGLRVWGKTIGIIGLGNIGKAVAHRARAFHMPILYHNRSRDHESEVNFNAGYCGDLDELLATSDIVSIHCPLSRDTQDLIDHRALKTMKSSSILINTSRGGVINEDALIRALDEGTISGAGLDVYENEPNVRHEFRKLNNIILSPHVGTATSETRNDMGFRVVENIETFFATGTPKDLVSP